MRGWMPSGVAALLAWVAIGVCLAELVDRRELVMAVLEESVSGWVESRVTGGKSYVSEGRGQ